MLSRLLPRAAAVSRISTATQNLHRRWVPRAMYSEGSPISKDVITARVLETLKGYEKIDQKKVCIEFMYYLEYY